MSQGTLGEMARRLLAACLVILLLGTLTACGGGSSSENTEQPSDEVPSDTPPETEDPPETEEPPGPDTAPDAFSFEAQSDVAFSEVIDSNVIVVTGTDSSAPISVVGGEYAIDGGDFTSAEGTVEPAQSVQLRLLSGDSFGVVTTMTLTIGGISAEFTVTTLPDSVAPQASVHFPLPISSTTSQTIIVRGTAVDEEESEIVSVLVEDVAATSDDGFATWQAEVPVPLGRTTLHVSTEDSAGNIDEDAAHFQLTSGTQAGAFASPTAIEFDAENNRALVVDAGLDALIAVDLTTRVRTIISAENVGSGQPFSQPESLAFDAINNRVLVIDKAAGGVLFSVNPATGDRTVLSSSTVGGGDVSFSFPSAVALDTDRNRVLVLNNQFENASQWTVYAVDLETGFRSRVDTGGVLFGDPEDITVDAFNSRALIVDSGRRSVIAIDFATGARTNLSGYTQGGSLIAGGDNIFDSPVSISMDAANNRALVMDATVDDNGALFGVDLTSGFRKVLAGPRTGGGFVGSNSPAFKTPVSVVLNSNSSRALILDDDTDIILNVATDGSGTRRLIGNPGTNALIQNATGMGINAEQRAVYIADMTRGALIAVNLRTGAKTFVSIGTLESQGPAFDLPSGVVIDDENNRALVSDVAMGVLAVDLDSGLRTRLAGGGAGSGAALEQPTSIALDAVNGRALVGTSSLDPLIAFMDLSTGHRTRLTGNGAGSGVELNGARDIILDAENHRALVMDRDSSILAVDLTTGERTTLSGNGVGEGAALDGLQSAVLDKTNNRLLVADFIAETVVAVDLVSGDRTVLSGAGVGSGASLDFPTGIQLLDNDIAVVLDPTVHEVFAVDLITGTRTTVTP